MSVKETRECGECTACCQGWLKSDIQGEYPGKACQHCTEQGCGIYDERPEACIKFKCLWLTHDKAVPNWMRPDKAKVITCSFKFANSEQPIITATPVGRIVPPRALNVLKKICEPAHLPLVYMKRFKDKQGNYTNQTEYSGYGSKDMGEILKKIQTQLEQ